MPPATTSASQSPHAVRNGVAFWAVGFVLLAAGAWLWSSRSGASEIPDGTGGQAKGTLHLETFVLNLADPGQRSYLRVGIDLGLAREMGRGEAAPVGQVRDTILKVLAEFGVDELVTAPGKIKLKTGLRRALQQRVPQLGVEEVYFTEFLIQR